MKPPTVARMRPPAAIGANQAAEMRESWPRMFWILELLVVVFHKGMRVSLEAGVEEIHSEHAV